MRRPIDQPTPPMRGASQGPCRMPSWSFSRAPSFSALLSDVVWARLRLPHVGLSRECGPPSAVPPGPWSLALVWGLLYCSPYPQRGVPAARALASA